MQKVHRIERKIEKLKKRDDYGHISLPKRHVLIALLLILKRDGQEKIEQNLNFVAKVEKSIFPFFFTITKA